MLCLGLRASGLGVQRFRGFRGSMGVEVLGV